MLSKVAIIFVLFSFCGAVFSISPCSQENAIKGWFGTLFYCASPVYTFDYARGGCENGELLAEIRDAYLYQNISNEIASKQGNLKLATWLNGRLSGGSTYYWPSTGKALVQFPHSQQFVSSSGSYYQDNIYWDFTAGLYGLSKSYLQSYQAANKLNSFLCLKRDVQQKLAVNPCINNAVNFTYSFGTFVYCSTGNVYSYSFARTHCPADQVLAEIIDASLYTEIKREITYYQGNIQIKAWLSGLINSNNLYYWPSTGEIVSQFPTVNPTYQLVQASGSYYRDYFYWDFNSGVENLVPSFLQSAVSNTLTNGFLCLPKRKQYEQFSNPCMSSDVNYTYSFGTLIYCPIGGVYSYWFAKSHCPAGEALAEIKNASLYERISREIAAKQGNIKLSTWLNGLFSSGSIYYWPSTGGRIIQFPHSQQFVSTWSGSYRSNLYWDFTAGLFGNTKGYLQSNSPANLVNSYLCFSTSDSITSSTPQQTAVSSTTQTQTPQTPPLSSTTQTQTPQTPPLSSTTQTSGGEQTSPQSLSTTTTTITETDPSETSEPPAENLSTTNRFYKTNPIFIISLLCGLLGLFFF